LKPLWLNINRNGGLGNRLFARAHVYAAACEFGATVADWGLLDVAKHFPNAAARRLASYPLTVDGQVPALPDRWWLSPQLIEIARAFRPRRTGQWGPFWSSYWGGPDPEKMALDGEAFRRFADGRGIVVLDGYKLRCTPWVRKHAAAIRTYFRPSTVLADNWRKLQAQWHVSHSKTVGVHMRATDFKRAQGGRYYLAPREYAQLLRNMDGDRPEKTLYVLFSDETYRSEEAYRELESAFAGLNHVFLHGDLLHDLIGLASCDAIVGPATSTFSRWAAFAGEKQWAGLSREQLAGVTSPIRYVESIVPWDY
jgi:hypothetical protein